MPRINWTRLLVIELSVLASVLLVILAWTALHKIFNTLLLFAMAWMLAFILAPLVGAGEDRGLPRWLAVACVYLALAAVLVVGGALLAGPFVTQTTLLVASLPQYVSQGQEQLQELDRALEQFGLGGVLLSLQGEVIRYISIGWSQFLVDLLGIVTQFAGRAFETILVLVASFYLLLDGPRLGAAVLSAVPAVHREKAVFVEDTLARVLGGYLRGQLTMGVILAVVVGVGMTALGVPYSLVLAVLAGMLELVPMFGPILSALPALAVAVFQPFPTVVWVLIFFVAVQQIETNVLGPRITGHAVGLHPLGAMFALLAGFEFGGALGAIFAVPVVGFFWVLISTIYRHARGMAEPPPPPVRWHLPRRRSAQPGAAAAESTSQETETRPAVPTNPAS